MNLVELQLDFYRRFNEAASKLILSKGNLLCTLLGHEKIAYAKSITCGLSMGVTAAARRLDGGLIKLESTHDNLCTIFRIGDISPSDSPYTRDLLSIFNKTGFQGAEILCDSDIPKCFEKSIPTKIAVYRAIMNMNGHEIKDVHSSALICAGKNYTPAYLASLAARRGWCTYIYRNKIKHYPLPLTGYKIITAQTNMSWHTNYSRHIEKELKSIRHTHPGVCAYEDITPDMLSGGQYRYLYYMSEENRRCDLAASALKACRIDKFANIVNKSQADMERYLNPGQEHVFLARQLLDSQGCICARLWRSGAYAIVEESLTDYVIKRTQSAFEAHFGTRVMFSVSDSDGTG